MNFKFNMPKKLREKNIMTIPAIILSKLEFDKKKLPIIEAVKPKDTNTNEKPSVKRIVLTITKLFSSSASLLRVVPEI